MSRLVWFFLWLVMQVAPAFAVPISFTGQGPTGFTQATISVPATSTLVTLTAPSQNIVIVNGSATATLYFSTISPATTSNFPILPNATYAYQGVPLTQFYVIGSTASGSFGVLAH